MYFNPLKINCYIPHQRYQSTEDIWPTFKIITIMNTVAQWALFFFFFFFLLNLTGLWAFGQLDWEVELLLLVARVVL